MSQLSLVQPTRVTPDDGPDTAYTPEWVVAMTILSVDLGGEPYAVVDIAMRMLQPRELARAQGFPDSYQLIGTKSQQVARIGNSVPPPVVEAIVRAQFGLDERARGAA